MINKNLLTEEELKRIYDFINVAYLRDSINIGIKTTVTYSNDLKDNLNTTPTVKVKSEVVQS